MPESRDPEKALLFPEQVKITCTRPANTCQELKVTLAPMAGMVDIVGIDETIWQISSWDSKVYLRHTGQTLLPPPHRTGRYRHVLAMSFASGAVSHF